MTNFPCTWIKSDSSSAQLEYIGNPQTVAAHPHTLTHIRALTLSSLIYLLISRLAVGRGTAVGNYKISTPSFLSNFSSIFGPIPRSLSNFCFSSSRLIVLAAPLVSSARVSHLSLASPLLTGGTCPRVPLRISRLLLKSISMLNSCWRGVGGRRGGGPRVERGWKGRGRERLRHYIEPQLFHTPDPAG